MLKKTKRLFIILLALILLELFVLPFQAFAQEQIVFQDEEMALIKSTQNGNPIKIGIIPHAFPLSECPPASKDYVGLNVEMLKIITQSTGLTFEYGRITTEEKTPYQSLKDGDFTLVAGSIVLKNYAVSDELILSGRLCDGSSACVAKKGTIPSEITTGKAAVMSGYQAGYEIIKERFPGYEIIKYPDNQATLKAVRDGKADLAMISRYVGVYELQSPLNETLEILTPYEVEMDSCVMGLKTQMTQTAISVINKALLYLGEDEYNHVQMNFSLTNPYKINFVEFLFKNRFLFLFGITFVVALSVLISKLAYSKKEQLLLSRDPLTGAFSEAGFELAVSKVLSKSTQNLFVTTFDISHFSSYNELNGKQRGDELLKNIVKIVQSFICEQDVICRSYADNFKVLSGKESLDALLADIKKASALINEMSEDKFVLNFGIYKIEDNETPIAKMLDFAAMAKKSIKGNTENCIGVFDSNMHKQLINDAKMLAAFDGAIANKEFVAYYQPKYDVFTKEIIGAEALVRWKTADGTIISPFEFIDLFEKNGQIQQLDFYMLEQTCILLKGLMDKGEELLDISVNFSRVHLYSDDFVDKVNEMVEKYGIPKHFIEIECTETTMALDIELTKEILGKLQSQGFAIAMDDFGKAYSSLNILCAIPLDIIKLDSGFLMATLEKEKEKSKTIIKSIVSLVHELSLKIIAEGVETKEQYLFLKSLGCDFIQGYYFAKPQDEQTFLKLLAERKNSKN